MDEPTGSSGWRRIYVDLPVDIAVAADVEAAKLRMSKKDFYAQAIREKIASLQPAEKPAKKGRK